MRFERYEKIERESDERPREVLREVGLKSLEALGAAMMQKNDDRLQEEYGEQIRMSDFVNIHGLRKVMRDQNYALMRAAEFRERNQENRVAKRLEEICVTGINMGGWLGRETLAADGEYSAKAFRTALMDDVSHRIDAAVDLKLTQPIESEDGKYELNELTLGLDMTSEGRRLGIMEKLTKAYSDNTALPFGFSHLDYYEGDTKRGVKWLVPRYVIALGATDVNRVWDNAHVESSLGGEMRDFQPHSELSLKTRFKVLSEIRVQNMLYEAMLPDDRGTEIAQMAALQLEASDSCLNAALSDCAEEMVARGMIPQEILRTNEQQARPRSLRDVIEKFLLDEGEESFRRRGRNQPSAELNDPFVTMMRCTRELLDSAYAPEDDPRRQTVEQYRFIMHHNQGFDLPNA